MAAEKLFKERGYLRSYMEREDVQKFREAVRRRTGRSSGVSEVIREFCLNYIAETEQERKGNRNAENL